MLKVVFYSRVSTDEENQLFEPKSIKTQKKIGS